MTTIAINALPPLVSALFLFSLAVVVCFSTVRHWLVFVFSGFCVVMGLSSLFGFLIEIAGAQKSIINYVRLEYFFAFTALSFANLYGIGLTEFRFGDTRKHNRIMIIILCTLIVLWTAFLIILFLTDWALQSAERLDNYGVRVRYGPVMWVILSLYFIGTIRNLIFFILSYRKTKDRILKEYIGWNMLAFHTVLAPAIWLLFLLPVFGLPTQSLAFLAFPISVLLFHVSIVRFHNAQLSELNLSLEQKVKARTEELKQTQSRLAQSERMASLGQLVAGVAHEMNNPVGAVKSMAETVTTAAGKLKVQSSIKPLDLNKMNQVFEILENAGKVITEGTKKITGVVDDLKSFARLDAAELQLADINTELEETVRLLENVTKPHVSIKMDLGSLPKIHCYPARLNQVFLNLIMNANEAIHDNGTITIGTGADNSKVHISVHDTGHGIPTDIIEKVFEPGFTTKGPGVGTGLGLAICYQIIRDHGGNISIGSKEGKGTTVRIELPRDRMVL